MYPYARRWSWWLRPRSLHLVAAVQRHPERLEGESGRIINNRAKGIVRANRTRLAVLVVLYFSVIAAITTTILANVGLQAPEIQQVVALVARITQSLTGIAGLGLVLVLRWLGQLEVDILTLLTLGLPVELPEDLDPKDAEGHVEQ